MSEKPGALLLAFSILAIAMLLTLRRQHIDNERLRDEVRVLRLYGNKDCTAMADEAMKKAALRQEDKT